MNANGVPYSSPGLRGTRHPGSSSHQTPQPQRGCAPCDARSAMPDGTALRFDVSPAHTQGRPHCIRPTLGWRTESRWDRNPVALIFHLFYANGVSPSSPGLRWLARYPGSMSRIISQPQRGCAPCDAPPAIADGTALRFDVSPAHTQGRPHCIRPTLGWRTESRWDRNPVALIFHLFYANGVSPSSPGLRWLARYPGSMSRIISQPQRGCAPCDAASSNPDGTALRFDIFRRIPQGRPRFTRPTLGWRAESLWDRNHGA